jgi:Na+-driven multidrug efflux pump
VYFNSREEVRKAFFIALLRGGLVMVPVLLLLIKVVKLGMAGVFLSFPVSEALILVLVLFMQKSATSKDKTAIM